MCEGDGSTKMDLVCDGERKKRRMLDPDDDKTTRFDKMTLLTTLDG